MTSNPTMQRIHHYTESLNSYHADILRLLNKKGQLSTSQVRQALNGDEKHGFKGYEIAKMGRQLEYFGFVVVDKQTSLRNEQGELSYAITEAGRQALKDAKNW